MHPGVQRCKLFDPSLVKLELLGLPFPSLLWRSGSRRSTCSCCHACSPMVSGSHAEFATPNACWSCENDDFRGGCGWRSSVTVGGHLPCASLQLNPSQQLSSSSSNAAQCWQPCQQHTDAITEKLDNKLLGRVDPTLCLPSAQLGAGG